MAERKDCVAVVDFKNPRDGKGNVVFFLTTDELAKKIAAEAYDKALKQVLERAEKLDW